MNAPNDNTRNLAHKIQLYRVTAAQEAYFYRACGTARWTYNKAFELSKPFVSEHDKPPTFFTLEKWIRDLKKENEELAWLNDVGARVRNGACEALAKAWKRYYQRRRYWQRLQEKKGKPNLGKPKFKKKGKAKFSFRAAYAGECKVEPAGTKSQRSRIWIPRLGWVKGREPLRFEGELIETRITRDGKGRWYAVILVKMPWTPPVRENQVDGGVDMGVKTLAVDSDGYCYESPKAAYARLQKRKRRWERKRSRRQPVKGEKPSKGYLKACARVAGYAARMAALRETTTHRVSHALVHKYTLLGIEDLNVQGMMAKGGSRKRGLNRGIAEASLATLRTQLEYKGDLYSCEVVPVDRFFASSKKCSHCGYEKQDLKLSHRTITCKNKKCGRTYDRDVNAAINIREEAKRIKLNELGRTTPEVTPRECDTKPDVQRRRLTTRRTRNPRRSRAAAIQLPLL